MEYGQGSWNKEMMYTCGCLNDIKCKNIINTKNHTSEEKSCRQRKRHYQLKEM